MPTFTSISLTLLFIFEVTWRMEHSRYFFSSLMQALPFSYIWLKYDILKVCLQKVRGRVETAIWWLLPRPGSTPARSGTVRVNFT